MRWLKAFISVAIVTIATAFATQGSPVDTPLGNLVISALSGVEEHEGAAYRVYLVQADSVWCYLPGSKEITSASFSDMPVLASYVVSQKERASIIYVEAPVFPEVPGGKISAAVSVGLAGGRVESAARAMGLQITTVINKGTGKVSATSNILLVQTLLLPPIVSAPAGPVTPDGKRWRIAPAAEW
jgi:hypothetical protein